ncbi:NAD(P)-binding protein [Xylaria digitata]|nr:NAD(P)-binding protein [Xylaria digitata]
MSLCVYRSINYPVTFLLIWISIVYQRKAIEAFKPEIKGKTFILIGTSYPCLGSQGTSILQSGQVELASRMASKVEPVPESVLETDGSIKTIVAVPKILAAILKTDTLVHIADSMATKKYTFDNYSQVKMANTLFTYGPVKRLGHRGVTATIVHSGYNADTKLGAHLTWDDYDPIDGAMKRNRGIVRFKMSSQTAATSRIAALGPKLPAWLPVFLQNS